MKWNKVRLEFLLLIVIKSKIIATEPTWYEMSEGRKFLIDTDQKYNWYQAWNECARYDAQLVAIENDEKNQELMKLLQNLSEQTKNLWIGGNVLYNKMSFIWAVNEQDFSYSNWATEKVNKFGTKKECVYIMRDIKIFPWNFDNCDDKEFGFICEEMLVSDEAGKSEGLKGSMYDGSIYGLIG